MLPDVSFVSIVLDISLRSLAVAAVVAFALAALRVRTAAIRHAAWTAAMLAMLFMPVLTSIVPALAVPLPMASVLGQPTAVATVTDNGVINRESQPRGTIAAPSPATDLPPQPTIETERAAEDTPPARQEGWLTPLAVGIYLAGLLFFTVRLAYGWYLAAALIGRAKRRGPISIEATARVYESPEVAVPMTVGVFRAAVILPPAWRTWAATSACTPRRMAPMRRPAPA